LVDSGAFAKHGWGYPSVLADPKYAELAPASPLETAAQCRKRCIIEKDPRPSGGWGWVIPPGTGI